MLFAGQITSYRPPDRPPDRAAANWILVATVCVLGFHTERLPLWLSLGGAAAVAWRFCIENRGWRVPGRWIRWTLALLVVVAIFREYHTLFGRDAGMSLLSGLVALKVLEIRSVRDYFVTVFLLYFLTLGGFLFSQSLLVGAYAVGATLVVTYALVRLNRPAALSNRQTRTLVWWLVGQAVPLMIIMYLLFPRIQGSLWGLPLDAFAGRSGLPEQMQPGSINQLLLNDDIAFRVEFENARPPNKELYWRSFVLADSDGRTWRRGAVDRRSAPWRARDPGALPVHYTLSLEAHQKHWLPTLELPLDVPADTRRRSGYAIETLRPVKRRTRYLLSAFTQYVTGPIPTSQRARYLALAQPATPRVAALVRAWRERYPGARGLVTAALDHFRREPFRYTLTPPLLGDNPVDEFLFDAQAGYCEHYASTFVSLMRLGGVPARVVIGYQGGEWNALGDYLIVRQSDAHAWAEVWLQDSGWTRVDPTGAVAPERIELGVDALRGLVAQQVPIGSLDSQSVLRILDPSWLREGMRTLRLAWDSVNNGWNEWVMAYGPENQRRFLRFLGFEVPSWTKMVATLAITALLVMISLAAWMLRPPRRDPVVVAWERYCRRMSRLGLARRASEGPLDYRSRVLQTRPDLSEQVDRITSTYVELRYGPAPPDSALGTLNRLIKAV